MIVQRISVKRALVVCDDAKCSEALAIAGLGYQVDCVASTAEAAEMQQTNAYDLVLNTSPIGCDFFLLQAIHQYTEDALRESNKRLELLADTASQLLLTDDPQGLVQSLCEKVMDALGCHAFFNFLVDEEKGCLHLNAFAGIPKEVGKTIEWLDYGIAVCGCAARDGCRIVAEDIFNTPDPRTELVKGYGIQAYACHPLLSRGGKVIGTLSFGSRTKTKFTDDELFLMKTVADQVATAMEKIRLLESERQHARELAESEARVRRLVDSNIIGVMFSNESGGITDANDAFLNMVGYSRDDLLEGRLCWSDMTPLEYQHLVEAAMAECRRTGASTPYENEYIRKDGSRVPILIGYALLEDSETDYVCFILDLTELKRAQQVERDLEAHKRAFYRRLVLAATEGKLVIAERLEIDSLAPSPLRTWNVKNTEELRELRDDVRKIMLAEMADEYRAHCFLGCVMEAAANAIKHANGGEAALSYTSRSFIFRISDNGSGIEALTLPSVALTKGFSTAGTLGMGYKLMIKLADKVYLATDSTGTSVAVEMYGDKV